eukprot:Seg1058.2 transcript_id=Seg1058.2/GoldUCD/mRNA.D3Y31 product="Kinesin-like protein KIF16B" protein_id=Seg1058.2/GoldUCD/D3Y31
MASVKVAVRVRPLNRREIGLESNVIIKMDGVGKKTSIINPNMPNDVKDFSYDHSYWSSDSRDKHFATQEQVFSDLGVDVINSAFGGYNACIFAYGQTGAGKSYTMMGMQDSLGLIPRICEGMYERMSKDQAEHKIEFKSEVSYIEIYNERVRDLLRVSPNKGDVYNLKVREHPKEGPYVQDLTKHIVTKYCDIEKLMDIGNENRTTASTNMNDTSSRSHAIFTLNFTQAKFFTDMPSETVSKIHLVDLAGSERANSTGATGQRLKEGANINKSLVTLGTVISNLAEASGEQKKKPFIPYRDSVLTWLLKDSLGGNSKTIMIAAISPADVNYSETLSTLRYANRAKNIVNKPTVNEDANVKLIRELRDEIEKLRQMLSTTNQDKRGAVLNVVEETKVAERISENQAKVEKLTRDWNNKWKETQKIMEERALAFRREGFGVKMESELPHLVCVDDDILSTGVTLYHLRDGRTHVGGESAQVKQDIVLHGPGIESQHCILESIEGNVTLHPIADECYINGTKIKKVTRLSQGAVILLGKTNMFRFNHPAEAAKLRQKYASVENLASIVPSKELEARSYLFYNAGLEMERRHREEAKILEGKRVELEKKNEEDVLKLEEARREIEKLKTEKREEEERIQQEVQQTQKHLDEQRMDLLMIKEEQERTRENAHKELEELKERIRQEQVEEKHKLENEMKKLLELKEMHQKSVLDREQELVKEKEELSKKWESEKNQIEEQRKEVLRLQTEFEAFTEESRKNVSQEETTKEEIKEETEQKEAGEQNWASGVEKLKTGELRKLLDTLERQYEDEVKNAQIEILQAKEAVKSAEMDTLQGKRGLAEGKMEVQTQWKKLESIQTMHRNRQLELQKRIKEVREELGKAEEAEEDDLVEQGKSILERKKKRRKVEEATQKLLEMESKFSKLDSQLVESKDLIDWQNREEIRELTDQRKILMELLSKHQVALLKASQMVTETKTKLESHLQSETVLVDPIKQNIGKYEKELEPILALEKQINRKCDNIDKEMKERKKVLYKQRKRINLLEKQLAQSSGAEQKEGLNPEELEDYENDRQAEWDLIHREKGLLSDMEDKFRQAQEQAEVQIGDACQSLEKKKMQCTMTLNAEKKKLEELVSVHRETTVFIEAELEARMGMLDLVKEKVVKDKKELAKLDMKKEASANKAAEELFAMVEMLEKDLSEKGNKEELAKIRDHRKKLQDLDKQLRIAEKREKFATKDGEDANCTIL